MHKTKRLPNFVQELDDLLTNPNKEMSNKLNEENKNEGFMVTLLTDNEYTANGNYFCIPLKYGSTEGWWINPFMISTREFAEIMD